MDNKKKRGSVLPPVLCFRLAGIILGQITNNAVVNIRCKDSALTISLDRGDKEQYTIVLESAYILWGMLSKPDPGLGETFMEGKWDLESGDLGQFLVMVGRGREQLLSSLSGKLLRLLTNKRPPKYTHDVDSSYEQIQHHYDTGNDLYKIFLDEGLNYSCAFFKRPEQSLRGAQLNKINISIERLDIKSGMQVLDIGCGWGETSRVINNRMSAHTTGISLAKNQIQFARSLASHDSNAPRYILQDYREHARDHLAYYDRIISIGMVEHVGENNLEQYFAAISKQLKPGGKALIHSIVTSAKPTTLKLVSSWLNKYIFPGGHIPEVSELLQNAEQQGLKLLSPPFIHESFHYAETLRRWRNNFISNFDKLDPAKYDDRFKRMWVYYLCMCEGMFEGCNFRVAQLLFEKKDQK